MRSSRWNAPPVAAALAVALVLGLWSVTGPDGAAQAGRIPVGMPLEFETEEQEQQYRRLIRELRCTVCQNQALDESNAGLAADLRGQIYDMTLEGNSREEIVEFMVARYGDFVLYRPPFRADTFMLWIGPFLLLIAGGLVWAQVVRQRQAMARSRELSPEERAALERLERDE